MYEASYMSTGEASFYKNNFYAGILLLVRISIPMPEFSEKYLANFNLKIKLSSFQKPADVIASISPFRILSASGRVAHGIDLSLFFFGSLFR